MSDPLLLSALFTAFAGKATGELVRFARRFAGESAAFAVEKQKGESEQIVTLGDALGHGGRINDEVFDALIRLRPDAQDVIDKARQQWREQEATNADPADPSGAAGKPGSSGPKRGAQQQIQQQQQEQQEQQQQPDKRDPKPPRDGGGAKRDRWMEEMEQLLAAVIPPSEGLNPSYLEAAALCASFNPANLRKSGLAEADSDDLVQLAAVSEPRADGRWVLGVAVRRETIARLANEGRLDEAVAQAARLEAGDENRPYRKLLDAIVKTGSAPVDIEASQDELLAARDIASWFLDSTLTPVDLNRVATILEAREKIEPLRKLVGTHFRGRGEQLALLRSPSGYGPEDRRILALSGVGGVGKSALLGCHLLELLRAVPQPPWVYLDFDRSEVDPGDTRKLIELIARNLGLLYVGLEQSVAFYALESASAGDAFLDRTDLPVAAGADTEDLLAALRQRVEEQAGNGSLLVVFDTFEQVMVRGATVVAAFTGFVTKLLEALPQARVIISGRGEIALPLDMHKVHLEDLDPASAEAVLEARGVADPALREKVIAQMGCSPLVLRIASEAIASGKLTSEDMHLFDAKSRALRLQGMLYTRVLGHIGDGEVERLAHPGLVVRRVTEAVIRDVLADVCKIPRANAAALFARLPDQVALFEPDPDTPPGDPPALRHRQDLREAVLDLMVSDPRWTHRLRAIHERAIDHYRLLQGDVAAAEELYHRMMLDQDEEALDRLWSDRVGKLLARSWPEPIPRRAKRWLGLRLGFDHGDDEEDLRLIDWEVRAARDAREQLLSGDIEGALATMSEREERSANSPLIFIEVEAQRAAGQPDAALKAAERGIEAAADCPPDYRLALELLAAETADKAGAGPAAADHARNARALAEALSDPSSDLRALELLVRTDPGEAPLGELERIFVESPERRLRQDEEVAMRIVDTVGPASAKVLRKAAQTFGNLPGQKLLNRDPKAWSDYLAVIADQEDGQFVLGAVAKRVGLSATQVEPLELATTILRHNLGGDALSTILERYGGDAGIRARSLDVFSDAVR